MGEVGCGGDIWDYVYKWYWRETTVIASECCFDMLLFIQLKPFRSHDPVASLPTSPCSAAKAENSQCDEPT